MKISLLFALLLDVLVTSFVNGEVDFCLEFDSNYVTKKQGTTQEAPAMFEEVSENIKNIFKESHLGTKANIPYDYFPLNISHPAITVLANLTNGTLFIDDQTIKFWTPTEDGLEIFNFTISDIYVNGSYIINNGYVGAHRLFDIYGNGTFELTMYNFSIAALTGLKINSSTLCIPLTIKVNVIGCTNNFKNFMNGDPELDPLLNGAMQSIVPDAVRIMFRDALDEADPGLQEYIDQLLHKSKSLSNLLYLLAENRDQLDVLLQGAAREERF